MFWVLLFSLSLISSDGSRDFYQILGVQHDVSDREIERAYMRLSRKYHPDKNKGNEKSAEMFTNINDAYGTLKDSNKRRIYDLYGEPGVHVYEAPQTEMDPMLSLSRSTHPDSNTERVRRKGKTVKMHFPVDLVDFLEGRVYPLQISRSNMCRCPQAGFYCPKCKGKPTIRENLTLSIVIEKGFDEGTVALFKNAGDVSEVNGPGNIEVTLVSKPHPLFKRKGSDLHITIPVTLKEALTGFSRTVQHIDGSSLNIQSNSPLGFGQTLIIPGQGLPKYLFPDERGDVVVHTQIKYPKGLSEEQQNELAETIGMY